MSFLQSLLDVGRKVLLDVLRDSARSSGSSHTTKQRSSRSSGGPHTSSSTPHDAGATRTVRSHAELPGRDDIPMVYSVKDLGMPRFQWTPREDSVPDPGEVVWTWVPFEEDRSQGKDRPVLVVAECGECIVFAQLTSKDHDRDAAQEARNGRFWMDIGTGDWDPQRRPSEVRIDRLLVVHPSQVRREGGTLDKTCFTEVTAAIRDFHR